MTITPGSVAVLIPAAGSGERMGAGCPKALLPVNGQPLFRWAISPFLQSDLVSSIIILVPSGCSELFKVNNIASSQTIVTIDGGRDRQESVCLGLQYCYDNLAPQARKYVVVHDAARAMLSAGLLKRVFEALCSASAVTAALPAIDSLITIAGDNIVNGYLDRSRIWRVQTPQAFQFELIYKAHRNCKKSVTDDASLVQDLVKVRVVDGEDCNIKITTPVDLRIAEIFLGQNKEDT